MTAPLPSDELVAAAYDGDVKAVTRLLAAGADPNAPDSEGVRALTCAALSGGAEVVRLLLRSGADPRRAGYHGDIVYTAISNGDVDSARVLLDSGVDAGPDRMAVWLAVAVQYNKPAVITWLLGLGADPASRSPADWGENGGLTPAELARKLGYKKVLAALEAGATGTPARPKTGRKPRTWPEIKAELKATHPNLYKSFRKAASEAALARVEKLVGRPLPGAVRAFYRANDGQEEARETLIQPPDRLDAGYELLPLSRVTSDWKMMKGLVEAGEFADRHGKPTRGVRKDWSHVGWLPVASNGGGDYFCVDLDPAKGGTVGQVIHFSHESPERKRVAKSFDAWLATEYQKFLESADAGEAG